MFVASLSLRAQQHIAISVDSLLGAANKNGVFNGTALVAVKGQVIYKGAIGYADAEKQKALTPDMLFSIGSISKEFNSAGIMLLVEQRKLRLTDKVSTYLTGLPAWADSIQIIQLLQYTSGLPVLNAITDSANWVALRSIEKLAFPPGSAYIYSNANVFLQMKIIEQATGMSYNHFITRYLLQPLHTKGGMLSLPSVSIDVAKGFDNTFKETVYTEKDITPLLCAGDLYEWAKALHGLRVIGDTALGQLGKRFGNNEGSLGTIQWAGGQISEHTHQGSGYNYECLLYFNKPEDLTIVLMTNNQNFKVNEIKDAIAAIVRGEPYQVPKRSIYVDLRVKVLENFDAGIAFYREICSSQPNVYDFSNEAADLNNTGKFLMRRNRFDEAIRLFQLSTLVAGQTPSNLSYTFSLIGDGYAKKGEKDLAILYYTKAVETDPNNDNAKGVLRSIR